MDARNEKPLPENAFEEAFDAGADALADTIVASLTDPMIDALMRADRVDVGAFRYLLRQVAARLRSSAPQTCC